MLTENSLRLLAGGAWLTVFALVIGIQLYDVLEFDNHLQHLTNWAWILHGVAAGWRVGVGTPPALVTLVPLGVAVFVAVGIACIQVMDNRMLRDFETTHGAFLVHFANFVFHYLPPLFWWIVVFTVDRKKLSDWTSKNHWRSFCCSAWFFLCCLFCRIPSISNFQKNTRAMI